MIISSILHPSIILLFLSLFPDDWKEYNTISKILFYVVQLPCNTILKLTVPPPDEDYRSPLLCVLWPFFFGIFCFCHFKGTFFTSQIVYEEESDVIFSYIGIVGIFTLIYMGLGLLLIRKFKNIAFVPLTIFSILALVVSCIWIWFLSNFVVDTLSLIGFITELPSGFFGLTLLGIGNCVGDFVADVSIAEKNLVDMAITGTYSSPVFNLLLGLGSAIIINCTKEGSLGFIPFKFRRAESYVTFWGTLMLLIYNFIFIVNTAINNFVLKKYFAFIGIGFYIVYLGIISYITFT